VRFVVVVDMRGRMAGGDMRQVGVLGLREGDMKSVSSILLHIHGRFLGWNMAMVRIVGLGLMKAGVQGDAGCVCKVVAKPVL
jgi:hypothetical protein